MEPILAAAERILHQSGAPALRLTRLLGELHAASRAGSLDAPGLLALLRRHPDRFRVLDPWRGPWRSLGGDRDAGDDAAEPWVVAVRDDGAGSAAGLDRVSRRLRESVRWLALCLDPQSARSVVRWRGLVVESLGTDADRGRVA